MSNSFPSVFLYAESGRGRVNTVGRSTSQASPNTAAILSTGEGMSAGHTCSCLVGNFNSLLVSSVSSFVNICLLAL